jgi:hypothetical protein
MGEVFGTHFQPEIIAFAPHPVRARLCLAIRLAERSLKGWAGLPITHQPG